MYNKKKNDLYEEECLMLIRKSLMYLINKLHLYYSDVELNVLKVMYWARQ